MTETKCRTLSEETPIVFAREELLKYASKVQQFISYSFVLGVEKDFAAKGLIEKTIINDPFTDAYQLVQKKHEIQIIGSNARSVLFGVYHVCKEIFGYKWISILSKEKIRHQKVIFEPSKVHKGIMKRRGLVIENYEDTAFLLQIIDWAAKQNINELFFTLMLWDKVKHTIEQEIEKRGLSITIGGHALHYILSENSISDKVQIDFTNEQLISTVTAKLKSYFDLSPCLKRLSLWPADIGMDDDQQFLSRYIEFTEQLKSSLPAIEVEHIAYNAGLSWNMLELRSNVATSKNVHTLFAYWGRNYNQSLVKEERAYQAVKEWQYATNENQTELTVFEYYSDHFMLGDLFPPLFHRINEDINMYLKIGIKQIVNLIVPYFPKEKSHELDKEYPWEMIQLMNSYFFAQLTWGNEFKKIEEDFYSIFEEKEAETKKLLMTMESILSIISSWNVPLFPNRFIDPESINAQTTFEMVLSQLKTWINELESFNVTKVKNIDDPNTLIAFYIHYVCEKLKDYLKKWKNVV